MQKYAKLLGFFLAVVLSIVIFTFRGKFSNLEGYGYLGLFLISILGNATIVLPIPVVITAFLGGGIFNPLWVGVVVALGATIGELTGYLAGYSGKHLIKDDKKITRIEKWMKKYGLWTIFVLAIIPNPAFDLAGIVAGATKIPVYRYLIVVWAGKLIKFWIFSFLGAGAFKLFSP